IYIVFRTRADAKGDFSHANLAGRSTSAAPKALPKPSIVVNTSATGTVKGKLVTIGITDVAFVQGNVIVQAATTSTSSTKHGDVPAAGADALATFASQLRRPVACPGPALGAGRRARPAGAPWLDGAPPLPAAGLEQLFRVERGGRDAGHRLA